MISLNPLYQPFLRYGRNYAGFHRTEWMLFVASTINSMGVMCAIYLSLYLKLDLHFSLNQIGWVISIAGIGYVISGLLGGFLSDYVHPRHMVIFSLITSAIMLVFLSLTTSISSFAFINFFSGIFLGLFRPSATLYMIGSTSADTQTRAVGLRRMGINLGFSLAGFFGGLLVSFGYKSIFYFDAILTFSAALCVLFFCAPQKIRFSKKFSAEANSSAEVATPTPRFSILSDRYFLLVCLFVMLPTLVLYQLKTTYPIYLHDYYRINAHQLGFLTAINGLLIFLIEIPLLNWLRQFNQEIISGLGAFLVCIGFAILPFYHHYSLALISCVIYTFGEILLYPTSTVLVMNCATKFNRGAYVGVFQLAFGLPQVLAPALGSLVYIHLGPTYEWAFSGLFGVAVLSGFYLLRHRHTTQVIRQDSHTEMA